MRRLPGPAGWRLGDGGNSRGSLGLFRDWQRTQTQSSVRTLQSLRQQMDVRSCGMQGPPAERQLLRVGKILIISSRALSRARPEISCFFLDFDLHGCRLSVPNVIRLTLRPSCR